MEHEGLRMGQISQVRGFADRQLRVPSDPLDPSNRRISVIVHYLSQGPVPESETAGSESPQTGQADDEASPAARSTAEPRSESANPGRRNCRPAIEWATTDRGNR